MFYFWIRAIGINFAKAYLSMRLKVLMLICYQGIRFGYSHYHYLVDFCDISLLLTLDTQLSQAYRFSQQPSMLSQSWEWECVIKKATPMSLSMQLNIYILSMALQTRRCNLATSYIMDVDLRRKSLFILLKTNLCHIHLIV